MSLDLTRRIFDPFFSTNGLGRGLGLAVVSGIAKAHGGAVSVTSAVGEGTLFQMLLPLEVPDRMEAQSSAEPDADEQFILIVDDEQVVRETARRILEHFGYKTLLASGGDEALQIYRDRQPRIALVLLDQSMPGKRGDVVFRELKAFDHEVCVVLTSGYSKRDVTSELMSEGLAGFVPKPFSADELLEKVSEHVPRRQ
jgi:CheY-like chemotaxis protein